MKKKFILIILFLGLYHSIAICQNINLDTTNWSRPTSIDPFNKNIHEFLNVNLGNYIAQATMAELQKDYTKAAQLYLYIIRNNSDDSESMYRLARCYSFLGKEDLSCYYIIRAVNAGYSNLDKITNDQAFNNIKNKAIYKNTIQELSVFAKRFGTTVYIEGKKVIKCRVKLPEKYLSNKEYTLIIGLHGNGGSTEGFIQLGNDINDSDIIFVAPEGPYLRSPKMGNQSSQYSWGIQIQDLDLWKKADPYSIEYIINVAKYFSKKYKVKNIYLLGFSQGAAYSYITGIKNQEIFKGIICIGGILPSTNKPYSLLTEEEISTLNRLKILIAHSPEDKILRFEHGKNAKKKLKKAGYDVSFISYKGGHSVPPQLIQKIVEWIKNN